MAVVSPLLPTLVISLIVVLLITETTVGGLNPPEHGLNQKYVSKVFD